MDGNIIKKNIDDHPLEEIATLTPSEIKLIIIINGNAQENDISFHYR